MNIRYQIIHWRDIPVRVKVRAGSARTTYALSDRFQQTVYRAAYRAKAINGEAYAEGWRAAGWFEPEPGTEPGQVGPAVVAALEAAYDDERLDRLARHKGFESDHRG